MGFTKVAQKAGLARKYKRISDYKSHDGYGHQMHAGKGTWALKPKYKFVHSKGETVEHVNVEGGGLTDAGKLAAATTGSLAAGGAIGGTVSSRKRAKRNGVVNKSAFGIEHSVSKSLDPFKAVKSNPIPKVGQLKPIGDTSPKAVTAGIKRSQKTNMSGRLSGSAQLPKSFTRNGR